MNAAARTWLVTGASAGLGRALVTELLNRGEIVAATSRDPSGLADVGTAPVDKGSNHGAGSSSCSNAGRLAWTGRLDTMEPGPIRAVVDEAVRALGRIDVAISNAGYGLFGAAEEATDEQVEQQIRTNLTGPIHLARALLPHLRAQGGGRIVQISSVAGQCAVPGMAVYHASKWGVEGFFEALAAEVRCFGIGVTIVEPGAVRTEFTGRNKQVTAQLPAYKGTAAAAVRRAVESRFARYPGDVTTMAAAIVDAATAPQPPLRLALGSDAYRLMHDGLAARLTDLEQQKDLAASTDTRESTAR